MHKFVCMCVYTQSTDQVITISLHMHVCMSVKCVLSMGMFSYKVHYSIKLTNSFYLSSVEQFN